MKTPSHALIGLVAAKGFGFSRMQTIMCILGACLADLPLMLAYGYFWLRCLLMVGHYDANYIQNLMDGIYFEQSWLLIAHNMFHSPVSIVYLGLIGIILCSHKPVFCIYIIAYLVGSFSHSILDLISHINDGPLIMWPLNDEIRITGMFSHWMVGLPLMLELASVGLLLMAYASYKVHGDRNKLD